MLLYSDTKMSRFDEKQTKYKNIIDSTEFVLYSLTTGTAKKIFTFI